MADYLPNMGDMDLINLIPIAIILRIETPRSISYLIGWSPTTACVKNIVEKKTSRKCYKVIQISNKYVSKNSKNTSTCKQIIKKMINTKEIKHRLTSSKTFLLI